jgi:hypothetical protein
VSADLKTKLINRSQVRQFALESAKVRAHKFTRVSAEFLFTCEAQLKEFICSHTRRMPSKGKTIV